MENLKLEDLLNQQITNIKNGLVDKRVISYMDYKNKYAILKSKIVVKISLMEGIEANIDITDYFEKMLLKEK